MASESESDTSVRKLSTDARVVSRSSLNVNSMGLPCGDYWAGRQSGGLWGGENRPSGRRGKCGDDPLSAQAKATWFWSRLPKLLKAQEVGLRGTLHKKCARYI